MPDLNSGSRLDVAIVLVIGNWKLYEMKPTLLVGRLGIIEDEDWLEQEEEHLLIIK